jgi:hypothetical protein
MRSPRQPNIGEVVQRQITLTLTDNLCTIRTSAVLGGWQGQLTYSVGADVTVQGGNEH